VDEIAWGVDQQKWKALTPAKVVEEHNVRTVQTLNTLNFNIHGTHNEKKLAE